MSSYQIIKLKNGEDLICNVLDNENGRLKVTTPLKMETVNRISKKGRYYEYVVKSYDGLVLKEAKEETVEKIKREKQESSKLKIDDDITESDLKDYLFSDKKTIH